MRSTLIHSTDHTGSVTTRGDLVLAPELRTRPEDLRPMRTGTKADLSWRTSDGIVHPVTVKQAVEAGMCRECGYRNAHSYECPAYEEA